MPRVTKSAPPRHFCSLSLPVTNFQNQFLVDLDWFILVLHFVPHIQLFKSPVLLDFYKNINFSKAEKRERYILIYKRGGKKGKKLNLTFHYILKNIPVYLQMCKKQRKSPGLLV